MTMLVHVLMKSHMKPYEASGGLVAVVCDILDSLRHTPSNYILNFV